MLRFSRASCRHRVVLCSFLTCFRIDIFCDNYVLSHVGPYQTHGIPPRARNDVWSGVDRGAGQFSGTPWYRTAASQGARSRPDERSRRTRDSPPVVSCAPLERGALRSGRSAHHCAPLFCHALANRVRTNTRRAPEADSIVVSLFPSHIA